MLILTNARLITPDEVIQGTLTAENGTICRIDAGTTSALGAVDCEGDFVIPGLIDLHTDAFEKHHTPRAGVRWPVPAAFAAHDGQMTVSGVTTIFDALAVGVGAEDESDVRDRVRSAAAQIEQQDDLHFRAEHFLHLRLELPHPDTADAFREFCDMPRLRLVSLTDHTPGQGQYPDLERWRSAWRNTLTPEEADARIQLKLEYRERYARPNRERIAAVARELRLPLASHDDRTLEDVHCGAASGVSISEFPVTLEAASEAKKRGLAVLMGGPNVVLGRSHSGNAAAAEVAGKGWLDGLTSDYVPSSMLHSAFLLAWRHGFPMPAAIATVTSAPAAMVGLKDRGSLMPGLRADLVRVRCAAGMPYSISVWRSGKRVA